MKVSVDIFDVISPSQLLNIQPESGVAVIVTDSPESYRPLLGFTTPFPTTEVVKS